MGGDQLDTENQRLRAEDEEASVHIDLRAELERTKGDIAELMERVRAY